jgi:carbonic anhydrase
MRTVRIETAAFALCLLLPASALPSEHGVPAAAAAPAAQAPAPSAAKAEEPSAKLASAPMTPPPSDPLDRLRQRLSERLATAKPGDAAPALEVRVVGKPAPAPAPAVAKAAGHGTGKLTAKANESSEAHAHWSYNGAGGPASWSALKPEFALCGTGQRQSPIDIRGGLSVDLEPVRFDYQASRFAVIDNGHTVQVNVGSGNSIEVGGKRFELVQFHFHRPSEERIDGRQFEMSVHLVHKDEQGRLAVVGLLFDKGPPQPVLQKVWNNLPLEKNEEAQARVPLELADLLPADRRYFTYMGSLTTPPCSEGVQWIVMRQPVTLTQEQIDIFARIYPMNARPVQSASGRRIMQSN